MCSRVHEATAARGVKSRDLEKLPLAGWKGIERFRCCAPADVGPPAKRAECRTGSIDKDAHRTEPRRESAENAQRLVKPSALGTVLQTRERQHIDVISVQSPLVLEAAPRSRAFPPESAHKSSTLSPGSAPKQTPTSCAPSS
jgi:hypothetical protein